MNTNTPAITARGLHTGMTRQSGFVVWLSVFLLLVIGVLLGGGFYLWKQQKTEMELLHQYVASVEGQLGVKDKAVSEFRHSLSKLAAETQSHDVILNDHLRMLEEDLTRVSKQVSNMENNMSSQNWLLSEVEYLMKLAGQRILIKEDVKGALVLLRKAEALIREMPVEDPGLVNVRVAIAKDIASMEMYRNIDVPGTYAELAALGEMIEKLPLVPTQMPQEGAENAEGEEAEQQPSALSQINDAFAGYITIRRHDVSELKALLSPEERLNVRDSMRLALDQAQTALLRADQRIYDESLSRIRRWVLQYFVADDFRTQQVARRLETLIKIRVEFDLPDIAISQQELKRYLADRMRMQ